MSQFKVTAKSIRNCLEEMSKDYPDRRFTSADIASKLLSNHFGAKHIDTEQKMKASNLVGQNLRSMINTNIHSDILCTKERIDSMHKHYPKIQKSVGYRIGEANGNVVAISPGIKESNSEEKKEHTSCQRQVHNPAMADAMQKAISDQNKTDEGLVGEEDCMVLPEAKASSTATISVSEFTYEQCVEMQMELSLRMQELFDEVKSKNIVYEDAAKAFQNMSSSS